MHLLVLQSCLELQYIGLTFRSSSSEAEAAKVLQADPSVSADTFHQRCAIPPPLALAPYEHPCLSTPSPDDIREDCGTFQLQRLSGYGVERHMGAHNMEPEEWGWPRSGRPPEPHVELFTIFYAMLLIM